MVALSLQEMVPPWLCHVEPQRNLFVLGPQAQAASKENLKSVTDVDQSDRN